MSPGSYGLGLLTLGALLAPGVRELSAQAQVISLAAIARGTLAVTVLSGGTQIIPNIPDNAVTDFPSPVVIRTEWNVRAGQTNTVRLVAYFSVPAQALVGPSTQVPSSRLQARMTTGIPVAFTPITQNATGGVGSAGGSLRLFSVNINNGNRNTGRTDNLDLRLNLVGFPPLAAGAYTGILNLRAVTQ